MQIIEKHGISFAEAISVFFDEHARQATIRMADDVVEYFKQHSEGTGIPYQSLINLYLRDCMVHGRNPDLSWQ